MPNISLADGFGLAVQASLNPKSAFANYFQHPPSFSVMQHDLASLQNVPLAGFPLKSTEIGLSFNQPSTLLSTVPQFATSDAVSASLCIIPDGKLFDPDPFGSPIEIPKDHAYIGLGAKFALTVGEDIPSGRLAFGFAVGGTVRATHYKSFATTATAPTFAAALQESLQSYVIPLGPDDVATLGAGDVALIEGAGSLEVSGTVNLLSSVNPLVSVSSSILPTTLQIQECAAIDVKACFTITGDFQIRIQKIDTATAHLGIYRKRGADFSVAVSPSVGITAGTSSTDFIAAVLGVIGPNPFPSAAELKAAGLNEEKQEAIVDALKKAIQRNLALSLQAELAALDAQEAAFLYEINLNQLADDGRAAIQDALKLNLSALSESAATLPRGIREIQSLLTTTRTKRHALKLNVLGIYNFASISDLTLKGTVLTDLASGQVVITDGATATRIAGAENFLADPDKLRKLLAQSFLITAAYRCSGMIAHAPTLKLSYWHFAEHARTDQSAMAADLHVLTSMGLISSAQEQQSLARAQDFGRSTFYVSTDYDDALSQGLFLRSDGQPRGRDEYEQLGRQALQMLIQPGSDDDYRLRALQNDAVWRRLEETGGTLVNVAQVFPDLNPQSQIPVIAGDYLVIEWWATTMARMAQTLSKARRFFAQDPPPASDSPAFKSVQTDLWNQMADVARNTHDRFSDPWGLLAMDLAANQQSAASAQIVSTGLALKAERASHVPSEVSSAGN